MAFLLFWQLIPTNRTFYPLLQEQQNFNQIHEEPDYMKWVGSAQARLKGNTARLLHRSALQ